MTWSNVRHQLAQVLATLVLFGAALWLNEWLFRQLEFTPGIHLVYLPAGVRLLCTLLFAEAGAVGLLIASWCVAFGMVFPDDFQRAFVAGILAALAPLLVCRVARHFYGLDERLRNLTSRRLLVLAVAYSLVNPLLQHLYLAWRGEHDLLRGFLAMALGDLTGTLIVLYVLKAVLSLLPRPAA